MRSEMRSRCGRNWRCRDVKCASEERETSIQMGDQFWQQKSTMWWCGDGRRSVGFTLLSRSEVEIWGRLAQFSTRELFLPLRWRHSATTCTATWFNLFTATGKQRTNQGRDIYRRWLRYLVAPTNYNFRFPSLHSAQQRLCWPTTSTGTST
jgi:hypothetical protein